MQPAAAQPVPAPQPLPGPAVAPSPARSRAWVWIAVAAAAVVLLAAAAVGAYVALRPPGPSSANDLSALLVDVPGKTTTIETADATSKKSWVLGSRGLRFSATRAWQDGYTPGSLILSEFSNAKDASSALATLRAGMDDGSVTFSDVPGLAGGFIVVSPNTAPPFDGPPLQVVAGMAAKGNIGVFIVTSVDSVDWVRALLVKQVNALP
jgi:hypothetical protein